MPLRRSPEAEIIAIMLGQTPSPPVILVDVAKQLGVAGIVIDDIRAGFTVFSSDGPVIHLSKSRDPSQRRFILAHELGHVILWSIRAKQDFQGRQALTATPNEERLADRLADTLLVPDSLIRDVLDAGVTLMNLIHAARAADVAPELVVRRLTTLHVDVGMLRWRREGQRWAVVGRPGVSSGLYGCLRPSFAGQWELENAGEEEAELVVDCYVNDVHAKVVGSGARMNEDVLQLLRPSQKLLPSDNTSLESFSERIAAALSS
jgi:hypothetical protein